MEVVTVEISSLDLRYEGYRMRNTAQEKRLLSAIAEHGIETPLEGVSQDGACILLNGFKRYRCAQKLKLGMVPYRSLGSDQAEGILTVLQGSPRKGMTMLEEARFIAELRDVHGMSVAEIAGSLSRSKGWVSTRLGLLGDMSPIIREKVFSGTFPAYSYMYIVRRFMRMNGIEQGEIDTFVRAVSGKNLSVREIELLAHGYFRGTESFREEIRQGNIALSLQQIQETPADSDGCSEFERQMLRDLELVQKYMQRVIGKAQSPKFECRPFHAQAHLLLTQLLSRIPVFQEAMEDLHARCGQA